VTLTNSINSDITKENSSMLNMPATSSWYTLPRNGEHAVELWAVDDWARAGPCWWCTDCVSEYKGLSAVMMNMGLAVLEKGVNLDYKDEHNG
jgi:hypothetical protein